HDTSTPVKIAVVAMLVNVICSVSLLHTMQHTGIALANSIALWTNATLLFTQLKKRRSPIADAKLKRRLPRLIVASMGMATATWAIVNALQGFFAVHNLVREGMALAIIIAAATVVYGILLHVTGAMQLHEVLAILKRKPKVSPGIQE
ncbi:MAG TPA: lipid II flippase MurJ, partial [Alphaproteobacteria bacterium]|nr:lipid II flippase MurJ [Alphaproteobacteria bacterium]